VPEAPGADDALLERLRAGDEAAFVELVRASHGALTRLAVAFVRDRAAAEEVVQEAWLAVVAQIGAFEGRASLRTWIGAIVANKAKTRGERDRRFVPFSALAADEQDAPDAAAECFDGRGLWKAAPRAWDAPEDLVLRKEARALVERAIEALPPAQRTVVELRDVEEWSSDEVCNVLGLTETNQRVLLHRGRMRLRAALERHYAEVPPSGRPTVRKATEKS
jgi:RNA polymerase sigma-70 factor (ECF subfamily)